MAPVMLPYLVGRPVNLHRFPDGVDAAGFWHKARPGHAPDWVTGWRYPDARPGETQHYLVADSAATLAWLANYGAVELNPWTSCTDDPRLPTWALIDIDPGPATSFDDVLVLARLFRTALDHLGVVGGAKVTGQRGVQIYVPIEVGPTFEETRTWVERLSRAVGSTVPDLVSWRWHKGEREGRARLDYTQNAVNKTLVAPYSARPAAGAPVSVPIEWDELDDPDLRPDRWTIHSVGAAAGGAGRPLPHPAGAPTAPAEPRRVSRPSAWQRRPPGAILGIVLKTLGQGGGLGSMPAEPVAAGPAVRLRDVSIVRGGRTVWSHGTFDVPAGSVIVVIGPNGSGKTTLLEVLLGLLPVAGGEVEVLDGRPPAGRPAHRLRPPGLRRRDGRRGVVP